jgi:hypothetical protein
MPFFDLVGLTDAKPAKFSHNLPILGLRGSAQQETGTGGNHVFP